MIACHQDKPHSHKHLEYTLCCVQGYLASVVLVLPLHNVGKATDTTGSFNKLKKAHLLVHFTHLSLQAEVNFVWS